MHSHGGESPDAPLEEAPAAVARLDAVVLATRLVAAHLAQHVHFLVHRKIAPFIRINYDRINAYGSIAP